MVFSNKVYGVNFGRHRCKPNISGMIPILQKSSYWNTPCCHLWLIHLLRKLSHSLRHWDKKVLLIREPKNKGQGKYRRLRARRKLWRDNTQMTKEEQHNCQHKQMLTHKISLTEIRHWSLLLLIQRWNRSQIPSSLRMMCVGKSYHSPHHWNWYGNFYKYKHCCLHR